MGKHMAKLLSISKMAGLVGVFPVVQGKKTGTGGRVIGAQGSLRKV